MDPTPARSAPGSPGQKRKREDSPFDDRIKRAPPANMSVSADTQAYIDNIDTQHVAATAVNVAGFDALQQATQDDHHHHHQHTDGPDPSSATSTAQAALGMYPTLHVPPSTEEQFAAQVAAEGGENGDGNTTNSFGQDMPHPDGLIDSSTNEGAHTPSNGMPSATTNRYSASASGGGVGIGGSTGTPKPSVGSEEWHKMRKDNHKEVERRRRETINEGINELAKTVPGCEKNKGSILQRAVSFISQLKENEQQNIEKWTLEKLLTEQAITELSASNDKLKQECERLYRELETWKRVAQNAGLEPPQPKEEPTGSSTAATG